MTELAECHLCDALMVDDPEKRRKHVGHHAQITRQIEAIRRALTAADQVVRELRQEVADLRRELDETTVLESTEGATLVINTTTDDELEDDDEPLETHDDTDLADEADITTQLAAAGVTAADLAAPVYPAIDRDDDDDLDLRIARQTGAIA